MQIDDFQILGLWCPQNRKSIKDKRHKKKKIHHFQKYPFQKCDQNYSIFGPKYIVYPHVCVYNMYGIYIIILSHE